MVTPLQAGAGFARLAEIIKTLRGDKGCPWDREQDEATILNYLLEEVYEVVEAVQLGKADSVCEELGDVLMEVVFLAQIYEEKGAFRLAESVEAINSKMVRRHPHVFGDLKLDSSARVVEEWHRQKQVEKNRKSLFDGLPRTLPALAAALEVGQRASLVGFDWERAEGAWTKLEEELQELKDALSSGERKAAEREMGDLLFAAVNVSRLAGVNAETALLRANRRFQERLTYIESRLRAQGRELEQAGLDDLNELWEDAKARGIGD